jgi:hypothetical protein
MKQVCSNLEKSKERKHGNFKMLHLPPKGQVRLEIWLERKYKLRQVRKEIAMTDLCVLTPSKYTCYHLYIEF